MFSILKTPFEVDRLHDARLANDNIRDGCGLPVYWEMAGKIYSLRFIEIVRLRFGNRRSISFYKTFDNYIGRSYWSWTLPGIQTLCQHFASSVFGPTTRISRTKRCSSHVNRAEVPRLFIDHKTWGLCYIVDRFSIRFRECEPMVLKRHFT